MPGGGWAPLELTDALSSGCSSSNRRARGHRIEGKIGRFFTFFELLPLFLYHKMAAYRKQNSCDATLIRLIEDWKIVADRKECVTVSSTDMSKVFDSLLTALMIQRLKAYGFSDTSLNLVSSLEESE